MTRHLQLDDLYRIAIPQQPTISRGGETIVYALRTVDRAADSDRYCLWQVDTDGTGARRLTSGPADTAPALSPDGGDIAFLRSAGAGPAQLWLLPVAGGEARQLTTLPLGAGRPVWRPDGGAIAFAAPVDPAATPVTAPVVVDRLGYKADGSGLLRTARAHLHVLDLGSGEVIQLTEGDWHAGEPAWAPDSGALAFSASLDAHSDLTLASATYLVDPAQPGARPRLVGAPGGSAGPACFTADGGALLVVGSTRVRAGHAGLLRVPVAGETATDTAELAAPRDLAASLDRNVMPGGPAYPGALPQLTRDGNDVLFCIRDRGDSHLYRVGASDGTPTCVLGGAGQVVSGLAVAAGADIAAIVLSTPGSYGEVVTIDLTDRSQTVRTDHGAALPDVELFEPVPREFTAPDGTQVQGWLISDPNRQGPVPLLLDVHGGPHNAWNGAADAAHLYHQILVDSGWSVLLVNPRGSDGYGEEFFTGVVGGWGIADAADLTSAVDQLVAECIADPGRLAISGYSYGGFMTAYLTGRDHRFAAAVAGGVVSDLASSAGTSDLGHYLSTLEFGGTPLSDPARLAAMNPIERADQVRTPTLILHGAADDRCPVGQAEQWFTALREAGVPTRMVLYPGGSHLFLLSGRPSHRADYNRRLVDWVQRYAGGQAAAEPRAVATDSARPGLCTSIDAAHWQRRLSTLAARHRVPGAALGILRLGEQSGSASDELVAVSAGVLNNRTGVPTTDDSVFQIGSITKVWTATLVMQLVDEGLLDLDAPIVDVLPELRLSDPDVAQRVTMRHLLTHTSGIDGDVFTDTGRGDDCLERYVDQLDQAAQNHPLGATFSYCNSGFVLAGRVIENITGKTWDAVLAERLIGPLGLEHTATLPEDVILLRAAAGHLGEGGTDPTLSSVWGIPRSSGPAGVINADVADVLTFARMHLAGGLAPDGTRLLSEDSVAAMQAQQADLPDVHTLGDSWGLGWIRFGWEGRRLFGHDGNTIGQSAFLRILPDVGLAVTLLTNGGNTKDLYEDLYREIFAELAGVQMPLPLQPLADPPAVDPGDFVGRYERAGERIEILVGDGGLVLRSTTTGSLASLETESTHEFAMSPARDNTFVIRPPGTRTWSPVTFYRLPTGARYVHQNLRATPLRAETADADG